MIAPEHLPTSPGCYPFKDKQQRIIYIGKAKHLRKRVKNYFAGRPLDPKTQAMLEQATSIEIIATDSELEAIILENTLIKRHQPKYNIDLKDAKGFSYIRIPDEPYPRVLLARQRTGSGKFYGPFISAQERDYLLRFIRKTFHIRTCKKLPKRPCLRYHIQLCDAPCTNNITKQEYNQRIAQAKLILSGHASQLLKTLETQMKHYAQNHQFEQAMLLRNQITAIQHLNERQNMQRNRPYNEDIINYTTQQGTIYLMLFNIYKGTLANKQEYIFAEHEGFFEEFLMQYYSDNPLPKELILPHTISNGIQEYFNHLRKAQVKITIPQKGAKKQLLTLVTKNIELTFFADQQKIEAVKTRLNLQEPAQVIECFDISHLSGTSMVGSVVQFRNGKPDKTNYRRFLIRTVEGIDDTAAITEIVRRRYYKLKLENIDYPDLVLIDGGRAQLNAAIDGLRSLSIHLPVIALAKQFEELYLPGQSMPLKLDTKDIALQFLREIRDEAHRFAIAYNRLLRTKELIA
ncbi:MAG: excinuclease ABC subunit UvrC [Candidatus Thermoplasmatota archaeon]|nr:excinuclease ABC subunit UvrC [Candidatus Thermoplasmatota archaeon]